MGCILEKEGKILLVQESQTHRIVSARGKWNIPAGRVDEGTSIIDNAKREVREEIGYEVELDRVIGIHERTNTMKNDNHIVRITFAAHVVGGQLLADGKEITDAKWFTPEEILSGEMKLRGIKEIIQDYVNGKSCPLDIIGRFE